MMKLGILVRWRVFAFEREPSDCAELNHGRGWQQKELQVAAQQEIGGDRLNRPIQIAESE